METCKRCGKQLVIFISDEYCYCAFCNHKNQVIEEKECEQKQEYPLKEGMMEYCKVCGCDPCHCTKIKSARKYGAKYCDACGQKLGLRGGYVGTDLCGSCCTGEADTLEEKFIEW